MPLLWFRRTPGRPRSPFRFATAATDAPSMRLPVNAYVLLAITSLCWSGNHVLARAMHNDMPPMALAFWRWSLASLILLPFVAAEAWRHRMAIRRHWRILLLLAVLGVSLNHAFLYTALSLTTAVNVGLINAATPIVIPIVSYLIDREGVTGRQVFGIAVSLVGVLIILSRADLGLLLGLSFTPGDLFTLGSVVVWAFYSVLLKRLPAGLPLLVFLLVLSVSGTVLLVPLYAWELATVGGFSLSVPNILTLAYISALASVVAFIFWNEGVARVGANKAGLFQYLIPVSTVVLAVLLLGEELHLYHLMGGLLTIAGLYLTSSVRRPPPTAIER